MDPITLATISASVAAGAAIGYVGGRMGQPGRDDVDLTLEPTPAVDPRVVELDRENEFLRRLSGLDTAQRLKTTPTRLGEVRDPLEDCLSDIFRAKPTQAAAFFDEEALMIAGRADELTEKLSGFLAAVRPPSKWRRIQWEGANGARYLFEVMSVGRTPIRLGVASSSPISDTALAKTRYAIEGLRAAPRGASGTPIAADDCRLKTSQRMAKAHEFLGIAVIAPGGKPAEALGARAPKNSSELWRTLERRKQAGTEETVTVSWTDDAGYRYSLHPFEGVSGRGLLLTVTDAAAAYPHERVRQWTRQLARELDEKGGAQ